MCFLLGSEVDYGSAGAATELTREQLDALTLPDSIIVDESDVKRLGFDDPDAKAKINGKEVKLVGTVRGLKSLAAPWVFCSLNTARHLLSFQMPPDHVTYLLARCASRHGAGQAGRRRVESCSTARKCARTRPRSSPPAAGCTWLLRTKAGVAIGYAALLGLFVGAVITGHKRSTPRPPPAAKEFAILLGALGIPRWRIELMVLRAVVLGRHHHGDAALAYPACQGLRYAAKQGAADVDLRWEILLGTAAVTLGMALISGVYALWSVRRIEPMSLLR